MCGRCHGGRSMVLVDGKLFLKHYCFSPPIDPSKPPGFYWVTEPFEQGGEAMSSPPSPFLLFFVIPTESASGGLPAGRQGSLSFCVKQRFLGYARNDNTSTSNKIQKLFCFFFQHFGSGGFQIETKKRLGIGRANVEPPIGIINFNSIKFTNFSVFIFFFELCDDRVFICDFAIDFSGMKITFGVLDQV